MHEAVCVLLEGEMLAFFFVLFSILEWNCNIVLLSSAVIVCFLAALSCWPGVRGCLCVIGRAKCWDFFIFGS